MDARVQDYLDDRLQTLTDFDTLDTLLESVQTSQTLLKQQLDDAKRDHGSAEKESAAHSKELKARIRQFTAEQEQIDQRLLQVTSSSDNDEAVRKFETSMERLSSLDIMFNYIEMLSEADSLAKDCHARLESSDPAALAPYYQLQRLHQSLLPLQQQAEGAAPHLVDHVAEVVYNVRQAIQARFSQDLEKTLTAMQWPKVGATVPLASEADWARNIARLLDLQRPELETRELHAGVDDEPAPLIALEVLVKPLEQRFSYHFSGNKPTNRLDKPEYFLNHIIDLLDGYTDFLGNALQPQLLGRFRQSNLALVPAYIDATSAFITALLPMLKRKLGIFAAQIEDQPNLLSHLIHEVIKFDTTLHESFAYTPRSPAVPWRGLSWYLLDTCGYYEKWLDAEKEFALTRYQAIVDTTDAGELDFDSVPANATKPSKAAIRVNDLLETITDQYRALSSFSQKLRFLIDIQIAIFDKFHARLHSSLEAYMTMTSSVARTVHGISKEEQRELQGVKGLDRLCRIFGSADYLERAMRDWSDDIFFLELWDELQGRANKSNRISVNLGKLDDIRAKTSSAIGATSEVKGALFDETADAYRRLRVRSEGIIVETLTWNTREALKSYAKVNHWTTLAGSTGSSLTTELEPTLRLLSDYLTFLSNALGKLPLRRVIRQLCHAIQTTIWDQVLLRHSFSTAGAAQFRTDIDALCGSIDRYIGQGQAQSILRKLCEGIILLNLPVKGVAQQDEDAAWDDNEEPAPQDGEIGLWEAERLIFKDNEGARSILERLGLDALTEQDARQVLEKRVETSI